MKRLCFSELGTSLNNRRGSMLVTTLDGKIAEAVRFTVADREETTLPLLVRWIGFPFAEAAEQSEERAEMQAHPGERRRNSQIWREELDQKRGSGRGRRIPAGTGEIGAAFDLPRPRSVASLSAVVVPQCMAMSYFGEIDDAITWSYAVPDSIEDGLSRGSWVLRRCCVHSTVPQAARRRSYNRLVDTSGLLVILAEARSTSDVCSTWKRCDVAERCGKKGDIVFWYWWVNHY
ncbi:hypothetical protein GW17_00047061 [Ensete ventricosum]|nr:hypothetical protein GW17_00047061 [Ensete ventricosum]